MPFKRIWDNSCPRIWDQWESDGAKWVVQDLPPEDDDEAVKMMIDIFLNDETLCTAKGANTDPASIRDGIKFWKDIANGRTSLACYREVDGKRELVALNMCPVKCIDDVYKDDEFEGEPWRQVIKALSFGEKQTDSFKLLGVDKFLGGAGLVVRRDLRGARLGARLLEAREPMCRALGIKATVTLFTAQPSQKLAARVGFNTIAEVTFKQLAESGLPFTADINKILKLMAKKYD